MENGDDDDHGAELQHETCFILLLYESGVCFALCVNAIMMVNTFESVEGSNFVVAFALLNAIQCLHTIVTENMII